MQDHAAVNIYVFFNVILCIVVLLLHRYIENAYTVRYPSAIVKYPGFAKLDRND